MGMMLQQTKDCQGVPSVTSSWKRQKGFFPRAFRVGVALWYLACGLPVSGAMEEQIPVILSHLVCSNLL
jgi:hypothetical protein